MLEMKSIAVILLILSYSAVGKFETIKNKSLTNGGGFPKEDVHHSDVLVIGIVLRVFANAFDDLLLFCSGHWVVLSYRRLHPCHIVRRAVTESLFMCVKHHLKANPNSKSRPIFVVHLLHLLGPGLRLGVASQVTQGGEVQVARIAPDHKISRNEQELHPTKNHSWTQNRED